jgi:hypothetical protein
VVVGPDGPRSRCRMHGGHLKSGKQTPEGRKRIADAVRKRMLAFWDAWRKHGKPRRPAAKSVAVGPNVVPPKAPKHAHPNNKSGIRGK